MLPWAILPEVDHIVWTRLGLGPARAFRMDLAEGAFMVEWGEATDLERAVAIDQMCGDPEPQTLPASG